MRKMVIALAILALVPALLIAGPNPGDPAPDFNLPDSAGVYHRLSDYRGKVVLLNFWQSG